MHFFQHDCQEFLALLLDTLHEQLNEGSIYVKALDEANKENEATGGRQQSIQSEDSEMAGSASQSGVHTPADRSTSQSPVEQSDNPPNNSNIVQSLSCVGDQAGACITRNKLQYISEDSNQSETRSEISYQSSELPGNEDHEQRMKAIHEEIKQRISPDTVSFRPIADAETMSLDANNDESDGNRSGPKDITEASIVANEENVTTTENMGDCHDENCVSAEKRLSLEDFYMKDNKTLNVNVIAEEYMHEEVATDSEKFHKHDNVDRPSDSFETLSDFIMNEVKSPTSKPLKDSNLLANFKEKFDAENEAFPKKCLFSDIKNLRG